MNGFVNSSIDAARQNSSETGSHSSPLFCSVDHVALAVHNLDDAIHLFQDVLGFKLERLHVGKGAGTVCADMVRDGMCFVLCQGTGPESQVYQLVENFGAGLYHVALAVDDVPAAVDSLTARGLSFDTTAVERAGLAQVCRCPNTGMSIELIDRNSEGRFLDNNSLSKPEENN
ncbi:VOC family protein [Sinorhizobium meliloti]|uniref:VOC family protein n=1 Tax=Rhizobium meliloti TaxID=382 RepID=UPI0020909AB5|nr:VOC family protein [Sinorhizobium meliloti]MCO5966684.1 VOC family protein [Sinorhizobium meliloti]